MYSIVGVSKLTALSARPVKEYEIFPSTVPSGFGCIYVKKG